MKKALICAAALASSCSGQGETIQTPSPAPETTTTAPVINPAVLPPDLTIATAPPTTEPEEVVEVSTTLAPVTTIARRSPVTTEYLRSATTIPDTSLDYGGWAIPAYIVMCESGGNWNAYNPSGASGPYQLMPLHFGGELAMNQSRQAQHDKAAELWNGGKGKSHWSACL